MVDQQELITIESVSPDIIYSQDKAQIDTQIATAKAFPRDLKKAVEDSIFTATLDVETASSCNYALPRGGKTISGPSIHLALILAQNWGNLRIEAKVSNIDAKTITSQAVCFDLEKNIAIKVEVKRSIMTRTGRMNDDMITVTGNAANSISLRNAILKVIPKAVVDKVSKSAKQLITGDISDETKFIKKRTSVLDGFKNSYGVTEQEVLNVLGKPSTANITADDLVTLIGYAQSIKDGDSSADLIFRNSKEHNVADKKEELKNKKAAMKVAEEQKVSEPKTEAKTTETPASEQDMNAKITACKTIQDLDTLKKEIPSDDFDLAIALDDKKRELNEASKGGLFKGNELP
ncbi:hypothetical protein [Flavobacterium psychrophilum]|uniref:Uncharacterized protein n=1 Tax=Flavobacterium psychrophilum TaxID=96345 RepID=A0A7U2R923_FLAPS|nr:hypothetical protein [Flavobacterium psychrophilum]QRE03543.1 hypothetical protein H0H26_11735 [Flavobacterium psychrophilum]